MELARKCLPWDIKVGCLNNFFSSNSSPKQNQNPLIIKHSLLNTRSIRISYHQHVRINQSRAPRHAWLQVSLSSWHLDMSNLTDFDTGWSTLSPEVLQRTVRPSHPLLSHQSHQRLPHRPGLLPSALLRSSNPPLLARPTALLTKPQRSTCQRPTLPSTQARRRSRMP